MKRDSLKSWCVVFHFQPTQCKYTRCFFFIIDFWFSCYLLVTWYMKRGSYKNRRRKKIVRICSRNLPIKNSNSAKNNHRFLSFGCLIINCPMNDLDQWWKHQFPVDVNNKPNSKAHHQLLDILNVQVVICKCCVTFAWMCKNHFQLGFNKNNNNKILNSIAIYRLNGRPSKKWFACNRK